MFTASMPFSTVCVPVPPKKPSSQPVASVAKSQLVSRLPPTLQSKHTLLTGAHWSPVVHAVCTVHTSVSQATEMSVPPQVPAAQTSAEVQTLPSSQTATLSVCSQVPLLQASSVHGLSSSQCSSSWQSHTSASKSCV